MTWTTINHLTTLPRPGLTLCVDATDRAALKCINSMIMSFKSLMIMEDLLG